MQCNETYRYHTMYQRKEQVDYFYHNKFKHMHANYFFILEIRISCKVSNICAYTGMHLLRNFHSTRKEMSKIMYNVGQ